MTVAELIKLLQTVPGRLQHTQVYFDRANKQPYDKHNPLFNNPFVTFEPHEIAIWSEGVYHKHMARRVIDWGIE